MQPAYIASVQKIRCDSGTLIFCVRSLHINPRLLGKQRVSRSRKSATARHSEVCPPAGRKDRTPFEILAAEDTAVTIAKYTMAGLQSPGSGDIAVNACASSVHTEFNFPNTALSPSCGLRSPADSDTIRPVTPTQRRGRSMSRRRGQRGYVEQKGNWWHLRYRSDTLEGRPHKSQPICLAVGEEKKTKSEAERLGAEWLAEQGVNTELNLAKAISPTVTLREQSDTWLSWLQTRNNKPIPQTSVPSIRSALKCWLLPALGDLPLSQVDELALNGLVKKMVGKLSPKTITTYINLAKEVVESQRDGRGRRIPHPQWDNEAIDLPEVNKREQRRPKVNGEGISQIVGLSETMLGTNAVHIMSIGGDANCGSSSSGY